MNKWKPYFLVTDIICLDRKTKKDRRMKFANEIVIPEFLKHEEIKIEIVLRGSGKTKKIPTEHILGKIMKALEDELK